LTEVECARTGAKIDLRNLLPQTYLPDESKVLLLHPQQLAGGLRHYGAVPRQVMQYGLPECGTHAQVAQSNCALKINKGRI